MFITLFHIIEEAWLAHTHSGNRARGITTKKRLAERNFAPVAHTQGDHVADLVDHPLLHRAGTAAMLAMSARIAPMLGKQHGQRQFAFHLFGIRSAAKGTPREAVGVHAVGGRASTLSLRV